MINSKITFKNWHPIGVLCVWILSGLAFYHNLPQLGWSLIAAGILGLFWRDLPKMTHIKKYEVNPNIHIFSSYITENITIAFIEKSFIQAIPNLNKEKIQIIFKDILTLEFYAPEESTLLKAAQINNVILQYYIEAKSYTSIYEYEYYFVISGNNINISFQLDKAEAELLILNSTWQLDKTKYTIPYGSHTWEIFKYGGRHKGKMIAQVELQDGEKVIKPSWITKEIYSKKEWTDEYLAKN